MLRTTILALLLTLGSYFGISQAANAALKPLGRGNNYEEYKVGIPERLYYHNAVGPSSQLNYAFESNTQLTKLLYSRFEYGLYEHTNIALTIQDELIANNSHQQVDYMTSKFKHHAHDNSSCYRFTIEGTEFFTSKNQRFNEYYSVTYGLTLPQIYNNYIHSDSYNLMLGAGYYNGTREFMEFEAHPALAYHPKHKTLSFSFDTSISFYSGPLRFKASAYYYSKMLKITEKRYLNKMEEYLKYGPINRVVGQNIAQALNIDSKMQKHFVDEGEVSLQISRECFGNNNLFMQIGRKITKSAFSDNAYTFMIGLWKRF